MIGQEETVFLTSVLKSIPIHGSVLGDTLEGRITQEYVNTFSVPLEVVYTFPTPENAAVTGLLITIGNQRIETGIVEREQANQQYAKAIADGNSAFLLESERPNVNRLTLGRVEPGERIVAETRFCMTPQRCDNEIRLAIPTTIAPRYIPCRMLMETPEDAHRITPPSGETGYMVELDLEILPLNDIRPGDSPSHDLLWKQSDDGRWLVTLKDGCCEAGSDMVVLYHEQDAKQNRGILGADETLLAQFIPDLPVGRPGNRAYTILLDSSGSMEDKMDTAKEAVRNALTYIRKEDDIQLLCFNNTLRNLPGQTMCRAGDEARQTLRRTLQTLEASGGTEILLPLRMALEETGTPETHDILLITDGQVGNESEIITMTQRYLRRGTRLFTIGIGQAANSYLVSELALVGGGMAENVFPGENLEAKCERQMIRCAGQRMENVRLSWADDTAAEPAVPLTAVFDGDTVSACVCTGDKPWPLTLSAAADGQRWTCVLQRRDVLDIGEDLPAKIAARQKLRKLERDYDACGNAAVQQELKERAIALSVESGVLCRFTTFYSELLRPESDRRIPLTHEVPVASLKRLFQRSDTSGFACARSEDEELSSIIGSGVSLARELLQPRRMDSAKDSFVSGVSRMRSARGGMEERNVQPPRKQGWEGILSSGISHRMYDDLYLDGIKGFWERDLHSADYPDFGGLLKALIRIHQADGPVSTACYNAMLLAADELLETRAFPDVEGYVSGMLEAVEHLLRHNPDPKRMEQLLDVITVLLKKCGDSPALHKRMKAAARHSRYQTQDVKRYRLKCAFTCLQLACEDDPMLQ